MQLETDGKFTRPGVILLITGVVALILRLVVDSIPWIGGLLACVCWAASSSSSAASSC